MASRKSAKSLKALAADSATSASKTSEFLPWPPKVTLPLATDHVTVFFHTSPFDNGPSRSVSTTVDFPEASNDTLVLVRAAKWGARRIWKPGYRYAKAGLMTVDIVPLEGSQRALIGALDREKSGRLMEAIDACNRRHGRGVVVPAAAGIARQQKAWVTKFEMRSPRYTTRLDEVPVVGRA